MEFSENLELPSDDEMEEEMDEEEPENQKIVTKLKIEKWSHQLETGNYRALLPVSQSLYASIIALDTNKEQTKDDKKMANNMVTQGRFHRSAEKFHKISKKKNHSKLKLQLL